MRTHLTINFDRALVCFSNGFWFQNVGTVDDNHLLHGFKLPLVVDCVDTSVESHVSGTNICPVLPSHVSHIFAI